MTTLRPTASLWRRTRATLLAGSFALGTLLAPGAALADTPDANGGATAGFQWDGGSLTDATAYVASRDGLDLRAEPSPDADVLATIPDGALVDLRIDETDTVVDSDGVTRWWPVAYGGQSGWVPGQFLTATPASSAGLTSKDAAAPGATSSTSSTASTGPFEWNGPVLEGATATVAGNGESVNVRAEPTTGSDVVTKVADGTLVNLRIDEVDTVMEGDTRWWPVEVNGQPGWISGDLLTASNAAVFPAGSTALVQTQAGSGAKLRAAAGFDADQIGSVPEGATVTIVSGPASHDGSANGWFEVDYNGTRGFLDGDLLVLLTAPAASSTESTTTASTSTRSGTAPATSATSSASSATAGNQQAAAGTQPGDTDNQLATSQPTEAAGQQPAGAPTGTAPASQETPAPTTGATEPAQQPDEAEQPDTDATRPWQSTTPTPTTAATSGTTPTATATAAGDTTAAPTPTQAAGQQVSSAGFIQPVQGAVQTQGFGCSSLGFYAYNPDWGCGVHDGIDFAAPAYTPIHAVADGTVVTAGWCDCGLGYYVEIDHGNGVHTLYGHMATQPTVRAGQKVTQGQQIGPVGSTGLSTGPHTHFMVQVNGVSQDPARYLP